jgi:transposase
MLRVDQVHVIRHKVLVEGLSIRRVAREMRVSRNTVRKYLQVSEPLREEPGARPRPVLERVRERLETLIRDWEPRSTRKQRITGTRLHRQLIEEGFQVGVTLVRDYWREYRRRKAEVFVPLVHRRGDEAQIDFFEVTVEENGRRRKAWKFLVRLMYSGRDFAWLYDRCDQVSFLDGHVRAFEHFGAVPHRCVYDNLKAAVARVVLPRRELTGRFLALVSHYLFEPCFARVGRGDDKGGVEARGKGVRLQHLTPIPRGGSLREIATELLAELDRHASEKVDATGRSVTDRFAEEQPRMRSLPLTSFDPARVVPVSIRKTALVQVEGAWYSVPSEWARLDATAYIGPDTVKIICRGEIVAHDRQPFGSRSIRYRHYLTELSRKPQAVRQVAPELLSELEEPFGQLWTVLVETHGPREAARVLARVLAAVVDHGEEPVRRALQRALETDRVDLLALTRVPVTGAPRSVPVPDALAGYRVEAARITDYDVLLASGARR